MDNHEPGSRAPTDLEWRFMPRLFLIRHAEPVSAWGEADDPCLSERGLADAEAAAERLLRCAPLTVVCSPMARCRETAAPLVRRLGRDPTVDPRVSEIAAPAGVADRRAWLADTFSWRGDGPATRWVDLDPALRAWRHDLINAFRDLEHDHAVFTHFVAINALVGVATQRAETVVCKPHFASVTELAVERGRLRLVKHGRQMGESGEVL